jgi:hypothetical protein
MIENVLINTIATARKLVVGRILILIPTFLEVRLENLDDVNSNETENLEKGRPQIEGWRGFVARRRSVHSGLKGCHCLFRVPREVACMDWI